MKVGYSHYGTPTEKRIQRQTERCPPSGADRQGDASVGASVGAGDERVVCRTLSVVSGHEVIIQITGRRSAFDGGIRGVGVGGGFRESAEGSGGCLV